MPFLKPLPVIRLQKHLAQKIPAFGNKFPANDHGTCATVYPQVQGGTRMIGLDACPSGRRGFFYFCEAEKSVKILLHAVRLDKHGLLLFILRGDIFLKAAPGERCHLFGVRSRADEKIRANPFNLCHPCLSGRQACAISKQKRCGYTVGIRGKGYTCCG